MKSLGPMQGTHVHVRFLYFALVTYRPSNDTFHIPRILVATISLNYFVLVLCVCVCVGEGGGYRTIVTPSVAKWGVAQMCLCEAESQGGDRTILGSANLP